MKLTKWHYLAFIAIILVAVLVVDYMNWFDIGLV
jgi:hypothetical protein